MAAHSGYDPWMAFFSVTGVGADGESRQGGRKYADG